MERIISKEEMINSEIFMDHYDFFVNLLNKGIEYEIICEEVAEQAALNYFSSAAMQVKKYSEEEYLKSKEKDQLIKNYFHILNSFLSSFKPFTALQKIINESSDKVMVESLKWYENETIKAYQIFDSSEKYFKEVSFVPAINYTKFMKNMYKIFSSKLTEIDIRETDIISLAALLDEMSMLSVADIVYSDMLEIGKSNLNFIKYLEVSNSMEMELKFLKKFDIKDIKELIKLTKRKIKYTEVIDGKLQEFETDDYIYNLTALVFKQFLFSTTYHDENDSEMLIMTQNDAKLLIMEVFSGYFDLDELYRNVEKISWYKDFSEEEKTFFTKLKPEILHDIKIMKEGRVIHSFYIY